MATEARKKAETSLRVYQATAKRMGLNLDGVRFSRNFNKYNLFDSNEQYLLSRGSHTFAEWQLMLDSADEALKMLENAKEAKERELLRQISDDEATVIIIRSDISAKVLESAGNNGVEVKIKDDSGIEIASLPLPV